MNLSATTVVGYKFILSNLPPHKLLEEWLGFYGDGEGG